MMTPHTVIEPILPGEARAAEVGDRREPEQRDHADAGRDRRRRHPREERREVADRRDRDRDVADREREEVEQEHQEVAGLAVGVLGVGRHAARALVEDAGLREAVGDRHRADRRHDPRQQRDRADLRHVGRQHDDAGAHHVHGDDERELHQVHFLLFWHTVVLFPALSGSFLNHVGVELDATDRADRRVRSELADDGVVRAYSVMTRTPYAEGPFTQ